MTPLPTPQQLRYLLALAEHRHFGRAADACAVTQSTLSAGLMALERQLNAVLLDRSAGRRITFTPLGHQIIARARRALAALEAVVESADTSRGPMTGPLRLGVIPTIGPFLLPRLMPVLRASFPRLQLFLREDLTANLVARLESGKLDAVLLAVPCECNGMVSEPLARDELLLALPRGHRLAARSRVPVAALADEPLLLLEDGHCLRDHALELCRLPRGDSGNRFGATSLHTLVHMVAGGLGVGILPRLAVEAGVTAGTELELRPIASPTAWRQIGMAWRPDSLRAADYRTLAARVTELIAPAPADVACRGAELIDNPARRQDACPAAAGETT